MVRKGLFAVALLVLCAGVALAEEAKGKIKSVDPDKNTITVTDDGGKDHTFTLTDKTEILDTKGKELTGGLKAEAFKKAGAPVVITFEKKDDKVTVSKVKLES
jgi:hypothetical protein